MADHRSSGVKAVGPLYMCHGGEHSLTLKAVDDNPWINQQLTSVKSPDEPAFPVTITPPVETPQKLEEQTGVTWTFNCPRKPADAAIQTFELFWLCSEFTSPYYKFAVSVSLGHHRLEFDETSGDEQFQVIEFNETTTLQAREISYYTREAMPFEGQWKLNTENLGPAKPGADGRVTLPFQRITAGSYPVRVTVPSLYYESGIAEHEYNVQCLALTPWGNDAVLQVDDKPEPDVLDRGVICTRGKPLSLKLLNENLLLKGSSVSLTSADAKGLGLTFNPDLAIETEMQTKELSWSLNSTASAKSGLFKLQVHCSKLQKDWDISGHMLSADLKDEVTKIEVNGGEVSDFGALFFLKESRPLAVTFAESMRGLSVALEETGSPGMTYNPPLKTFRKIPENFKLEWQVTGGDISSTFNLKVVCADVETPLTIPSRVLSKITTDEIQSLTINGEPVDLARPELVFCRAVVSDVELIPKPASSLIGLDVALKEGSGAELGMTYDPPVDRAVPLTAQGLKWKVTGGRTQSGLFELLINIPQVEQSMPLACRLLSSNLADEAEVKIGGVRVPPGGNWFFWGQPQSITLTDKNGRPLIGLPVTLTYDIKSGLNPLNLESVPKFDSEQTTHNWSVTGKSRRGTFQLVLAGKGMTVPIKVTISKLLSNNLTDEADVRIDNMPVTEESNLFIRDKAKIVELIPKLDSPMRGLEFKIGAVIVSGLGAGDLVSVPGFNVEGKTFRWGVTGRNNVGTFQLKITCRGMTTPITLPISTLQ